MPAIELFARPDPVVPSSELVDVVGRSADTGEVLLGRMRVEHAADELRCTYLGVEGRLALAEADELLAALMARCGGKLLRLVASEPILRDAARAAGAQGALRSPLTGRPGDLEVGRADAVRPPEMLCALIESLVAGVSVRVRDGGAMRGALRRLRTGFPTVALEVSGLPQQDTLRFDVPDRGDILVEQLARCLEIVVATQTRLGGCVPPLRVALDHADFGLKHGSTSGEAAGGGDIHINASWVHRDGLHGLGRGGGEVVVPYPPPGVDLVYTSIDRTTAHEVWHQIDFRFQARHYSESIEFRRGLGEELGVETLEQALRGGEAGAPPAWRAACRRLIDEVSPYAATATLEATAEMFKAWWCPVGDPGALIARFGSLVEQFVVDRSAA